MKGMTSPLDIFADLEARHDDLLRRLEELDRRVESVLAEWQPARKQEEAVSPVSLQADLGALKRAG